MIKSIRFNNFFSFQDTLVDLHSRENILIGINGVGKSNFIKAIRLLKEGVAGIGLKKLIFDQWGGFDSIYFCGGQKSKYPNPIILEYTLDGNVIGQYGLKFSDDLIYKISIWKIPGVNNYYLQEKLTVSGSDDPYKYLDFDKGHGVVTEISDPFAKPKWVTYSNLDSQELALTQVSDPDRYLPQSTIRKAISDIVVYDYFDTTATSKIRKPMLPTSEKRLLPDGSNLPQILNTININHKNCYKQIEKLLNDVNEKYKGTDFNFLGGNIELMLEEVNLNQSIHVINVSDGTLRFLCLLSIFYNPDRGKIVCIDEPELGLHPDMILSTTNSIKESSVETQYIIATHSDKFLNAFELENVRVFEKTELNSTQVSAYSKEDFKGWYEEYSIGKMWRQGDLGGNRW